MTYVYQCPRCGKKQTMHIKPLDMVCEDYEAHHSNRSYTMELIDKPTTNKAD